MYVLYVLVVCTRCMYYLLYISMYWLYVVVVYNNCMYKLSVLRVYASCMSSMIVLFTSFIYVKVMWSSSMY